MSYSFHPAARQELYDTQDYYSEKNYSVGKAFTDEIAWAIEQIILAPSRWRVHGSGTRRFLLSRFPYSIIYRIVGDDVQIIAIAHHRRKPGYWNPRVIS